MKKIKELELSKWKINEVAKNSYKEALKDVVELIDERFKHNRDRDVLRELMFIKARIEG